MPYGYSSSGPRSQQNLNPKRYYNRRRIEELAIPKCARSIGFLPDRPSLYYLDYVIDPRPHQITNPLLLMEYYERQFNKMPRMHELARPKTVIDEFHEIQERAKTYCGIPVSALSYTASERVKQLAQPKIEPSIIDDRHALNKRSFRSRSNSALLESKTRMRNVPKPELDTVSGPRQKLNVPYSGNINQFPLRSRTATCNSSSSSRKEIGFQDGNNGSVRVASTSRTRLSRFIGVAPTGRNAKHNATADSLVTVTANGIGKESGDNNSKAEVKGTHQSLKFTRSNPLAEKYLSSTPTPYSNGDHHNKD